MIRSKYLFRDYYAVTNVLMDKEEIPRMNISNKVFNLNAGGVTYSRENFVAAVRHLGQGFDKDRKLPFYADNLSRIEALGSHGVMFPDWTNSCISMVNPRVSEEPIPATPIKPNFWANKPFSSRKSSKKLFSTLALVPGLLKFIRR
ncbi:hypothetical protein POM88_051136 [Heracleum sosnowskyi]|uniref:Uncharacterized protein n=1 Tax=Heracleum sosnowskyi TaxID=360622 RepID=A0AAD8H1G6_9APIA|nr:hypothetical protein POM88_051136 [Heracleum sosnowskyi]